MFRNLTDNSLHFLGLDKEFDFEKEDKDQKFSKNEEDILDDSNIFKIPKYLERVIYFS